MKPGRIEWVPDYGLPSLTVTGCVTGCHVWITAGRPKEGDPCCCGRQVWGRPETAEPTEGL